MNEKHDDGQTAKKVLALALQVPGVRINRDSYLRRTLQRKYTEKEVTEAIKTSPKMAGISEAVLEQAARASIRVETTSVTTLSAASGIPGGIALIGAVPADMAQYFGHMVRISQKLAYLYGWPHLFANDEDEIDDATLHVLIVFLGVMMGHTLPHRRSKQSLDSWRSKP